MNHSNNTTHHDIAKEGGEAIKDIKDNAGALASELGARAKAQADDVSKKLQAQTQKGMDFLRHQVRENPGLALGVAAGAGLFLGLLMSGRRH